MQIIVQLPKPRNPGARALADRKYHMRVVRNKKKYSRKGCNSSSRKYEDSIQLADPS